MIEFRRILVPLDGSALSEEALPIATALAHKFDSELLLLRVVDIPVLSGMAAYPEEHWTQEALQFSRREAQLYLDKHQMELAQEGLQVRTFVYDESPAEDILFAADQENVDLIVMTSHGLGRAMRWPSGSVAHKVMEHSTCPVLLVRQQPEEDAEVQDLMAAALHKRSM